MLMCSCRRCTAATKGARAAKTWHAIEAQKSSAYMLPNAVFALAANLAQARWQPRGPLPLLPFIPFWLGAHGPRGRGRSRGAAAVGGAVQKWVAAAAAFKRFFSALRAFFSAFFFAL